MKAARYYGPGDIRVEQIEEPEAGEGQLKVKIAWNGICGSDLHAFLMPMPIFPTKEIQSEVTGETLPVTLGHEFSGTVVGLGSGVDTNKWTVGQNVVIEPIISCMNCAVCASGSRNVCSKCGFIGISGRGGGLAEYITVDAALVHILPKGVSLEVGACIEPLAVAWHAVKRSGFKKGQSALVLGAGPIGIFLLKVLRSVDPTSVLLVSEPAAIRRNLTLQHGATAALDPIHTDVPAAAREATGGVGPDVVFDAAGVQITLETAIASVRVRGVVVNVAIWEGIGHVDMNAILMKEIFVTGTVGYDRVHPELLEAVALGKIPDIDSLITSRVAIEEVVEKGFKALLNDKDSHVKILVHP